MHIAFCVHPHSSAAREQRDISMQWLAERGIESTEIDVHELRIDSQSQAELAKQGHDLSLVCALGGDGTILRATRLAYAAKTPLLGVNFGHLGFLSGATAEALAPALEAFIAGDLHEDRRVMLKAEATFSDGSSNTYYALNEVLLGRSEMGKIIVVNISINGNQLPSPRGDGVIVATATGSTAYAYSAGGPLLTPDNQGLCIVPVSAQGFNAAALVSAPSDTITLSNQSRNDQHAMLCVDGQILDTNGSGKRVSRVDITKAERDMVFLRYDAPDFYTRIAHSVAGENHAH